MVDKLLKKIDLGKYEECSAWGARKWHEQLTKRYNMLELIRLTEDFEEIIGKVITEQSIENILTSPIDKDVENTVPIEENSALVRDISVFEALQTMGTVMSRLPQYAEFTAKDVESIAKAELCEGMPFDAYYQSYNSALSCEDADNSNSQLIPSRQLLTVDVNATDSQLLNQFQYWLHHKRQELQRLGAETPQESRFHRWVKYRVLTYLDILIVMGFHRLKATDNQVGNFLYQDDEVIDTTERVRKSLKKHAHEAISLSNFQALAADITIQRSNVVKK